MCHADPPASSPIPADPAALRARFTAGAIQSFTLRVDLLSELDGRPASVEVNASRCGRPEAPCLVVLGGISACGRAVEWWPEQVGPGRPIDTDRHAVLGIDYLDRLPAGWRGLSPGDQANALAAVLDRLAIRRVDAFVGASYGGAVALAFAERYPERVGRLLVLSMADRPSPMASALRAIQRECLRLGVEHGFEAEAVALARALAVTTYRSEAEFAERFSGAPRHQDGRWRWPVEDYLQAQGARFAERFDAERYRVLSESLDLHRVDRQRLSTPLHALAVVEDRLVPCGDIQALAAAVGGECVCIDSPFGHDAFLKEGQRVAAWLSDRLARVAPDPVRPQASSEAPRGRSRVAGCPPADRLPDRPRMPVVL